MPHADPPSPVPEDPRFLREQILTCLGNKRSLLGFIDRGLDIVRKATGRGRFTFFDAFSGSGIVSRYFKRYAEALHVNDLECYSEILNRCYLTNREEYSPEEFRRELERLRGSLDDARLEAGFLTELYAPRNDEQIRPGERVFYSNRNARYLDTARRLVEELDERLKPLFIGPLIVEASIHANTAGVFKGFYKDRATGIGCFGGGKGDALSRIRGRIELREPVLSLHSCPCTILRMDAFDACGAIPHVDVAYLDPPYNQHPYGSNYFMLDLVAGYRRPGSISKVSGIPSDWRRSEYNRKSRAAEAFTRLVDRVDASFVLVSFNSEGFIARDELLRILRERGKTTVIERGYSTFRGSRNLASRPGRVTEYLFVLEKAG